MADEIGELRDRDLEPGAPARWRRVQGARWSAILPLLLTIVATQGVVRQGFLAGVDAWSRRAAALEARYHLQQGHRCLAAGDLQGAIRAYQGAIAADESTVTPYLYLGYSYERLSRWFGHDPAAREEALRRADVCYREVALRDPALRRAVLVRLADLHSPAALAETGWLEADLQSLLAMPSPEPDWFLALARLREDAGRARDAETILLAAREAVPEAADVQRELGHFYRRYERLDTYLAVLSRRLRQAPEDRQALLELSEACLYRASRDHRLGTDRRRAVVRRGLAAARRLVRLDPGHPTARRYAALLDRLSDGTSQ